MYQLLKTISCCVCLAILCLPASGGVVNSTIIKTIGGEGPGFDATFDRTTFSTLSQSNIPVGYSFTGFLGAILGEQREFGAMLIQGINIQGAPRQPYSNVPYYQQNTIGGQFEIYANQTLQTVLTGFPPEPSDLLLSGQLGTGVLLGGLTGGFSSTGDVLFTGGSVLKYINPTGAISFSLNNIRSGSNRGFQLDGNGMLNQFQATITVQVEASRPGIDVPEPTSLLIFSAAFLGVPLRRRLSK